MTLKEFRETKVEFKFVIKYDEIYEIEKFEDKYYLYIENQTYINDDLEFLEEILYKWIFIN